MHFNTKYFLLHLLSASPALAGVIPVTIPTPTLSPSKVTLAPREDEPTAAPKSIFTTTNHITIGGVTNSHVTIPGHTIDVAIPTCKQTITPDENGYVPPGTCGAIWDYYPSFAAALTFAFLFGGLMVLHIWQAAKYKKVRTFNTLHKS